MLYTSKEHQQLIGEYFDKISESIDGAALILVFDKWIGQNDEVVCIKKLHFNMEPKMIKYLQPLIAQFFQDC